MSNEWSASIPTLEVNGSPVNHQYSKSGAFEAAFRGVLAGALGPDFAYFSALRPFSELWVARRFAALTQYHDTFRSCNRAFHIDKSLRLDHWCGHCDKCCFIDLILAPFVPAADLERIFGGHEPLGGDDSAPDPASAEAGAGLADKFRSLLGTSPTSKPFECVGEVGECRAAALLAAQRPDRAGTKLLQVLAAELDGLPAAVHPGRAAPPARPPLHPGCLCARRSPGLTCGPGRAAARRRAGRRPGRPVGARRGGPGQPPRAPRPGPPARARRRPPAGRRGGGVPGARHLRRRPGGPGRLRRGDQVAGHQPLPRRPAAAGGQRHPGPGRAGPVAPGGPQGAGAVHHRDQGQEQHHGHRGPPAQPVGLPVHGRREHRPAAVGTSTGGPGLRLLGDRNVQLPGHRPGLLAAGGGGDLAAPRSPALASGCAELLPGQAVRLLPAGRGPDRGQRRQRPAPGPGGAARPAGGVGARRRRPRRGLDGPARPAGRAQPAQRPDRPGLPARPGRAAGG